MGDQQFVLVVYDISNDRRRTKLHNALQDYGSPVQYSVFECLLTGDHLQAMKKAVERIVKPRVDKVRFYYLCDADLRKVEITSGAPLLAKDPVVYILDEDGEQQAG